MKKIIFSLFVMLCSVFLFFGYSQAEPLDWTQVNEDGFDNILNEELGSVAVFNDRLYVGTITNFSEEKTYIDGNAQVWRTNNGTSWEQVNEDGFGDIDNGRINFLVVFNLYIPRELAPRYP